MDIATYREICHKGDLWKQETNFLTGNIPLDVHFSNRRPFYELIYQYSTFCCHELKRATAYKGDKCSIFFSQKMLFGTNEIAVKQDQ